MDTYLLPPHAETERESPSGEIENKLERSAAEIRALIADIIADGMDILMSARYAPRHLIREGERLEESVQSALGNEPPRNLWQVVRNWVRSIIQWFASGDETNGQPAPDMEQRLEILEQRVDALADEMRAEFGRVHQRIDESAAAAKTMGEQLGQRIDESAAAAKTMGEQLGQRIDESVVAAKTMGEQLGQRIDESVVVAKTTGNQLNQRIDESVVATKTMGNQLNRRLDLLNESTTHARAKVVEDSLRNWAVSHHRWREILPPHMGESQD